MVAGAALARHRHEGFQFLFVGDETLIKAALAEHPNLEAASEILHAEDVVSGDAKPSQALRGSKKTSMGLAVNAVKNGDASAAVSAGNTGALMAISKLALRTMPGIGRPALAALLPTMKDSDVVMLDLGANAECDSKNLIQFAVMGAAYSRIMHDFDKPSVKLLNIGTEDAKGTGTIQEAAQACALMIAAQIKAAVGSLDRVERIIKLGAFVNSTPEFTDHPKVANGCSDMMEVIFGEAGIHARSAVGVAALPLGIAVEVDAIVALTNI